MPTCVIVNPGSAHQRTGRDLPRITKAVRDVDPDAQVCPTSGPGDATRLTHSALQHGCTRIVAVGGDGTINEVVNGFFDPVTREPVNPDAVLGVLMRGTGGDFRRSFAWSTDLQAGAVRAVSGDAASIDVGYATFRGHDGTTQGRFFVNIASVGLGGIVATNVNRSKWIKRIGGRVAFFEVSASSLLTHKPHEITLTLDGRTSEPQRVRTVAICNGRYHGGGMMIAPDASVDDGQFDVVVVGNVSRLGLLSLSRKIYAGTHVSHRAISQHRATEVTIDSPDAIPFEIDGETPGTTPLSITMRARALRLAGVPAERANRATRRDG